MFKTIILPIEIEETYFKTFYDELQEILESEEMKLNPSQAVTIDVICDGIGGEWNAVMSVINTIKAYSNGQVIFNGVIQSEAISGHSMIWASISNRTMAEDGEIGIHDAAVLTDAPLYLNKLERLRKMAERKLSILAKVYSKACNHRKYSSKSFWFQEIYNADGELIYLTYDMCKERGMLTYG